MPDSPPTAEVRVSTLVGDRLCIRCGYNLVGQPIVREGHYNMLIVRCPECATVASVQEYPLLGRWANRWAALLAALWALVMVGLWAGTSLSMFGFSMGGAELASNTYREHISNVWSAAQLSMASPGRVTPGSTGQVTYTGPGGQTIVVPGPGYPADFQAWWKAQDKVALLAQAGGWRSAFSWWLSILLFWMAVTCVVLGVVWSVALLARGRGGLLAWCLVLVVTAGLVAAIPIMEWLEDEPYWFWQAAQSQMGPIATIATLLWGGLWLALGMMIGRPAARGLVRLMLPPRLRSSLAMLWLSDGLAPPGTR
jgi:hypothetical protein